MTPADVARFLCCSERQVRRLRIPCIHLGTRKLARYQVGDVLNWVAAQKRPQAGNAA